MVVTRTFHIAACDICGLHFDEPGEFWAWDDTETLALQHVDDNTDWVRDSQRVICPRSDTAHYLARGSESPTLLRPGADAMTAGAA